MAELLADTAGDYVEAADELVKCGLLLKLIAENIRDEVRREAGA